MDSTHRIKKLEERVSSLEAELKEFKESFAPYRLSPPDNPTVRITGQRDETLEVIEQTKRALEICTRFYPYQEE